MFLIQGPPPFVPAQCLVTKKGGDEPFVDLGRDFDFDHVGRMYVHHSAIRDMWNLVKHLYEEDEEVDDRDERIRELEEEVEELRKFKESIWVIKSQGMSPQKKPGRKPKEAVSSGS